jgi:predicted RNase H-like HicB family nuclease
MKQYVASNFALCPELDIAGQAESLHAARDNIREAIELFLEHADPTEVEQRVCLLCTCR